MWVAKCSDNLGKLFEYDLSPRFDDVRECQNFIDEHLNIIEYLLHQALMEIIWGGNYKNDKKQYALSFGGRFIRCYEIKQKRFADGMDF